MRWEPHSDSTDHYKEVNAYLQPKGQRSSSFLKKVKCFVVLLQYNLSYFSSWQTLQPEDSSLDRIASNRQMDFHNTLHAAGFIFSVTVACVTRGNSSITRFPVRTFASLITRFQNRAKYLLWHKSLCSSYQDLFGTVTVHLRCHSLST